jgi:hypothetical protein
MTTAKEADAIYGQMVQRRKAERKIKPDRVYHASIGLHIQRPSVDANAGQQDGQVCVFSEHGNVKDAKGVWPYGVGVTFGSSSAPDSDGGWIHAETHLAVKQAILLRRLLNEAIRESKNPVLEE